MLGKRLQWTCCRAFAWPAGRSLSVESKAPLILDGAMGTELAVVQRSGGLTPTGVPFATVTPEGLEAIRAVSRKYCESGADVICTATYNVNDLRFQRATDEHQKHIPELPHILKRAVESTREVADQFVEEGGSRSSRPLVAAVMGSYGVAAEQGADYDFDYRKVDMQTLIDFHRARMTALVAGKPDILLFETISSLKEVRAIAQMLSEWTACAESAPLPHIWLACSCRIDQGESMTACGDSWESTVRFVQTVEEISAFGINCSWPSVTTTLLQEASYLTSKPLIAYPNNGTWHKDKQEWLPAPPAQFANEVLKMCNLTPKLNLLALGGCCCTGPEDIQALAKIVQGEYE